MSTPAHCPLDVTITAIHGINTASVKCSHSVDAKQLAQIVAELSTREVHVLDFRFLGLRDGDLEFVEKALVQNRTLSCIDISWNHLIDPRPITGILASSCAIRSLIARNNSITDSGAIAIANAIKLRTQDAPHITLDLSSNKVGDNGVVALAHAVSAGRVDRLDLSFNCFGLKGIEIFAAAVAVSPSLTHLAVKGGFPQDAAEVLLHGICNSKSLLHVEILLEVLLELLQNQ